MSDIQYSKETYNQLYNEVQRKITALLREIKPYIQNEIRQLYKNIKIEISGYFKTIVNTTFISVFTKSFFKSFHINWKVAQ